MRILNSYPVMAPRSDGLTVLLSIAIIIFMMLGIIIMEKDNPLGIIFLIAVIPCAVGVIYFTQNIKTGITEYQVILEENYSANELYKEYNVIKKEGEIWYIQDKGVTDNDGKDVDTK